MAENSDGQKQGAKSESWIPIETAKGTYSQEDCMNDIAEIKFDRPVPLKDNQKYAVLLKNSGQRTVHGDSGITKVRCTDGTVFTFTSCVQSINGTNIIRGQIPQILYYSTPQEGEPQTANSRNLMELLARRNAIDICGAVSHMATDLLHRAHSHSAESVGELLGTSHLFSSLLPLALAYAGPVAVQDPRCAVQVLYLVQEILPAVSGLTRHMVPAMQTMSTSAMPGLAAAGSSGLSNGNTGGTIAGPMEGSTSSTGGSTIGSGPAAADVTGAGTTSQHYALVESEHPYKPATVVSYKVEFPRSVRWMVVEFDSQCATAQPEDSLQLYVPAMYSHFSAQGSGESGAAGGGQQLQQMSEGPKVVTMTTSFTESETSKMTLWPVLKKFYGTTEWPKSAVLLPGNEVVFSLETASDYLKDEKASFFGFKCSLVGYEWGVRPEESILMLEREMAFLGGMCCSALMKRDIPLPSATMEEVDEDIEVIEEGAMIVFQNHSSLLEKGFALSQSPTIYQALEGNLPISWQSNEHSFLKDFVMCTPGTSGGRLARWLQPDSYLDPKQCEIKCNRDDLKCSWPVVVTVYTKDQYGQLVNVPNLKLEVRAIPIDQQKIGDEMKKMRKTASNRSIEVSDMTYGGHLPPVLDTPYEPTVKDKNIKFHAITVMKAYENYSFEELRLASPAIPRPSENMLVRANKDGTYTASWTPGCVGFYNIIMIIDGTQSGTGLKVEVKEPPQGAPPPAVVKKTQPPKLRRFVAKYSAGLRVRVSPTLQSEQIGVVPPNCTISFVDSTTNDDGIWLRLSRASLAEYCPSDEGGSVGSEGWCLQYNQHLGKTLLVAVETPKPSGYHQSLHGSPTRSSHPQVGAAAADAEGIAGARPRRSSSQAGVGLFFKDSPVSKGPGQYMVVKCGSSGHNIRARPSLKAAPIGMITKGKKIRAVEDIMNSDGVWIRLSEESAHKYCQSQLATEAWSLVRGGRDDTQYMQHESEFPFGSQGQDPFSFRSLPPQSQQGFQFAQKAAEYAVNFPGFFPPQEAFSKSKSMPSSAFNFGGLTGFQPKVPLPRFGEPLPTPEDYEGPDFPSPPALAVNEYNDIEDDESLEEAMLADRLLRLRQRSGSIPNPFISVPPLPTHQVSSHQRSLSTRKASDPGLGRLSLKDNKDIPPELQGVPVNELVKALGESRANGNGPTPQPSPPSTPKKGSREASPKSKAESLGSPRNVRDSSVTKEDLYKTPPSSPVVQKKQRAPLQKVDSFENSGTPTPPSTPLVQHTSNSEATFQHQVRIHPSTAGFREEPSLRPNSSSDPPPFSKPVEHAVHTGGGDQKGNIATRVIETKTLLKSAAMPRPSGDADCQVSSLVRPSASKSSSLASDTTTSCAVYRSEVTTRLKSPPPPLPVQDDRPEQNVDPSDMQIGGASGGFIAAATSAGVVGGGGAAAGACTSEGSEFTDFGEGMGSTTPYKSNMFTIGTASPRDDIQRASPKAGRKDRNRSGRSKRERAVSPSSHDFGPAHRSRSSSTSKILERGVSCGAVKEALSPAAAECLRTVFAAFMWHEGIVHDAMACASFLKFHPDLTKEMSKFVKEKKQQSGGSSEPRRQRHATESSKDHSAHRRKDNINESRVRFNLEPQYSDADQADSSLIAVDGIRPRSASAKTPPSIYQELPIKPLLCESKSEGADADAKLWSGYSGGLAKRQVERHKSEGGSAKFHELVQMAAQSPRGEQETQLPKTLQHLVHFWEELSESVVHVMSQDVVPPSPAMAARLKHHERREKDKDREKKMKKKKGVKPAPLALMDGAARPEAANLQLRAQGLFGPGMFVGPAGGDIGIGAAIGAVALGEETYCELCQGMFPHPVTYHMRQAHPGCGKHASGRGYNAGGKFGDGWAGKCGEGGIGECSWYLMCEKCRERYMREKKYKDKRRGKKGKGGIMGGASGAGGGAGGSSGLKQQNLMAPMEAHHVLKNNAQFLLELASASGLSLPKHITNKSHRPLSLPHRSSAPSSEAMMSLPSVSERASSDPDPFPAVPFQYLNLHNADNSDSAFAENYFVDADERVLFSRSGSMSIAPSSSSQRFQLPPQRPRLPTEPRHSPLARSGSLGQDMRPFSQLLPVLKHENTRAMLEKQPMTKSAGTSPEMEQDSHKKTFHRSVSEYGTENEVDGNDFVFQRAVSVSSRRRNNSGSVTDGGVSLLKHPSVAMTRLIQAVEKRNGGHTLHRPVMEFIVQRHDLEGLQLAMKQALRKAMCRVFALQAINWLVRSVVQQVCLHDLLWFFVDSLSPSNDDEGDGLDDEPEEGKKKDAKKDMEDVPICDHPMSDIIVAGKAAAQLPETFHNLLQTISDVMMLLPMGSALQQMAVRCYCLQFMQSDHQFLHESHVFSNLSRILSKSEEEPEDTVLDLSMTKRLVSAYDAVSHKVICLKDLTSVIELKASSRQAMIGSLTDTSTETFWESGDEDRNKIKVLTLTCRGNAVPSVVYVHVDNIRDIENKVSTITFNSGTSADDMKKIKLVSFKFFMWFHYCSPLMSEMR
ncbi:myc binding protein 2 [Plakobranchus ocellatus]|uniref:Myc binding protein 2 n=1 Tax=Plakobranchus ocellatus TaxID=259542 RepID=A0AAV3YIE1_9GAST|nr:myc binding protein 2 [Plakobranchus ocellatus]